VRLLESAVVEVPSLIGWLRPVVLLPASALTGLTPRQIEAILAHELAHVRRHDYLVNLAQTVIETLLFYHPGVWWVSRRARVEREHCCDDLVVGVVGDARGYALALTRMEELRTEASEYALALTGGELMKRIRRLLGMPEAEPIEGRWLAGLLTSLVLLAAAATMLMAGTPKATAQKATAPGQQAVAPAVEQMPGYVAFNAKEIVGDRQPKAEVNLNQTLLSMTLGTMRQAQPDLAQAINGMNLYLFQLRVYEMSGQEKSAAEQHVNALVQDLLRKGWFPIVRVTEENVNILMRSAGNQIQGFALLVAQNKEIVFGNLVCDVDANQLGERIGGLLNKAMAGQLNLQQLAGLMGNGPWSGGGGGGRAGGGAGGAGGPRLVPDGFKTNLEVEGMRLTSATVVAEAGAGGGKAVRFDDLESAAAGSIRLDPGIYKARLMMLPDGLEHDAVTLSVNGRPPQRVYRSSSELGPVNQTVQFEIKEPTDVKVEIKAAEMGMLLDRIQFERFKKAEPPVQPHVQVEVKPGVKAVVVPGVQVEVQTGVQPEKE
jgi:hypothetical protein